MGLLEWLGLGKPDYPPIPTLIVTGITGSGRKALIKRLVDALGPDVKIGVVMYDTHASEAIQEKENVTVRAYVHAAGACACHGSAMTPVRQSVRKAADELKPDALILQVGRGHNAQEVLQDLLKIQPRVKIAGMTVCLRADSAIGDLRDAQDDLATYVRAAGQVVIEPSESGQDWMAEQVRQRIAAFNPKALVTEDREQAVEVMKRQIEETKPK